MTLSELRTKHPQFTYESYQASLSGEGVTLQFTFSLGTEIVFKPTVHIAGVTETQWLSIPEQLRNEWVFQIGLAEMPSYWKAAAPQEIVIKAGQLSQEQLTWWHTLFIKGMGEFFYVNQIRFTDPEFLRLRVENQEERQPLPAWTFSPSHSYLVPVGGGKDSTLTLCLLNENNVDYGVFLLNPTPAASAVTQLTQPTQTIVAERVIDPTLLALNADGYLNGHVPFSAYLAFLSRFVALLFGYQQILISNERSSNEGNVTFLSQDINHQYSKTFEFEQGFEQYLHQSGLVPAELSPSFFSLMRPLYEVQISKLFATHPAFDRYATSFRSCNRGQRTNSWCGECPKCLFTFVSLYPFLPPEKVLGIFGKNLFDDPLLIDEARALLGVSDAKPFECVGTHEENAVAFYLACRKITQSGQDLPPLLQQIWDEFLQHQPNMDQRAATILGSWNDEHQIPSVLTEVLRHAVRTS